MKIPFKIYRRLGAGAFTLTLLALPELAFAASPPAGRIGADITKPGHVADAGRDGRFMVANGSEQEQRRRDDCFNLIYRFDQARTSNAEAIRLRQAAGTNCDGASDPDVYRGWDQIRQALKMINAY